MPITGIFSLMLPVLLLHITYTRCSMTYSYWFLYHDSQQHLYLYDKFIYITWIGQFISSYMHQHSIINHRPSAKPFSWPRLPTFTQFSFSSSGNISSTSGDAIYPPYLWHLRSYKSLQKTRSIFVSHISLNIIFISALGMHLQLQNASFPGDNLFISFLVTIFF